MEVGRDRFFKERWFQAEFISEFLKCNNRRTQLFACIVYCSYSSKKAPVNTTSAVLKIKSNDPQQFETFDKEASIYKSILPSFVDVWKKVGETIEFAPRLILSQSEPKNFLIFEDVCNHGYFSEEPSIGLNLEQSKIALQKLAFVHATSVVCLSKVFETLESCTERFVIKSGFINSESNEL